MLKILQKTKHQCHQGPPIIVNMPQTSQKRGLVDPNPTYEDYETARNRKMIEEKQRLEEEANKTIY